MAQTINTNIASLTSQRNLGRTQGELNIALQRLSSGMRINSAKDDAAGLAISERFSTQIRGLNQAVRNANDAISLSQTAEGALGENGNILQRIRELAVQSANATNSASDRRALNSEVQQLLSEVQRNAVSTQFNGQNIIDGTYTGAQFQIGANANQTILVNVGNSQTSALGSYQGLGATAVSGTALSSGDLLINGTDVGASVSGSAQDISTAINNVSSTTGVTSTASTTLTSANALKRNQSLQSGDLVINNINIGAVSGSNTLSLQGANLAAAINAVSNQTGVTASANTTTGALTLSSSTGANISITSLNGNAGGARVENATGLEVSSAQTVATLAYTFTGTEGVSTITFAAQSSDGDTFTLGGVTYEFDNNAAVTGSNVSITIGADNTATTAAAAVAINANTTNGPLVTATAALGVLTVTSDYATSSSAHITLASGTGAANQTVANSSTPGVGPAFGETITVGGTTYEFQSSGGTVTGTNTKVVLGTTATLTATAFTTAVNAANTAVTTNISAASALGVVTLTSQLLGASGTASVTDATLPSGVTTGGGTGGADGTYAALTGRGTLQLNSDRLFTITGANYANAGLGSAVPTLAKLSAVDISSVAGANSALSVVDGALAQIATLRADLGAVQNRFESTIKNLSVVSENLSSARSRIADADYASETAALTRAQILQQAGVAILSQANGLPQLVLSLLK